MLKIIINGITADLKGASKQELVFQNPMWDYEGMLGEYGLPFSLPFCPTNDRIFSNARSEFSPTMALTYLCEQYMNDDLIAEGLIVLKDTNGAYNCNYTSNLRDIFTPVSGSVRYDGYLRDILPTGPSVATLAARNAMAVTFNNIVCYPIIDNAQFYQANPPVGWAGKANDYAAATYQGPTFCPFVSVRYIFQQIQTFYGITFTGEFMTDAKYSELVIGTITAEDGATTSNLKIAVGDFTIAKFVNDIRALFALDGTIDLLNKKINLSPSPSYINAEVSADWSGICSPITGRNPSPYPGGILLSYKNDDEDKWLETVDVMGQYRTSPTLDCRSISTIGCKAMSNNNGASPAKMLAKGNTSQNNQQNQKVLPRLGFYRYVSSLPQLGRGNSTGTLNLRNSASGATARNTFLAAEETFWQNTFEASFQINLRKLNLSSFDIKSKVHIHGWNYLIKRIVMDCNNPEKSLLEAYRA